MHSFFQAHGFNWIGPEVDVCAAGALQRVVAREVLSQAERVLLHGCIRLDESADGLQHAQLLGSVLGVLDDHSLPRVALHPSFRYWVRALRRTSSAEGRAQDWFHLARHAVDFVWPELASEQRLPEGLSIYTDKYGGLRCVTRGLFFELGQRYASQSVAIFPSDACVRVVCNDGLTCEIPLSDFTGPDNEPPNIEQHGYALTRFPTVAEGRFKYLPETHG